jgi:hypothetical protein
VVLASLIPKRPIIRQNAPLSRIVNIFNLVVRTPHKAWNKPKANCPIAIAMLTSVRLITVFSTRGFTKRPVVLRIPVETKRVKVAKIVGFIKPLSLFIYQLYHNCKSIPSGFLQKISKKFA